ncbi:MAG: diacylglycerol kinase family lipid kinase [Clostridia bacterium]|nr:diacylglycerol kinase family lipid kinase [Clostridia bacterium]
MLLIIANPTSGSGAGASVLEKTKALLEQRGLQYRCEPTARAGHAIELADMAVREGMDGIVCLGGDGTIFEVVNGLAGRFMTLYFVPCGTGNDFVRMLNLPRDPVEALRLQLDGKPRLIDVGQVNDHYFLNVSGCGFDVEVLRQAGRFKKYGKDLLPYLLGILAALRLFKPLDIELTMGGKTERRAVTIISVGNGRYFGGGMMPVPHAEIDDGLFDVIFVDKVNRLSILRLLSRFIKGRHTDMPISHESRCTALTIRCPGMTINMDGELYQMDEAAYRILPGAAQIRV